MKPNLTIAIHFLLFFVVMLNMTACAETQEQKIQKLIKQLGGEDKYARMKAAHDLGQIGKPAAGAVPALMHALKDENAETRRYAIVALGKIGEPAEEIV